MHKTPGQDIEDFFVENRVHRHPDYPLLSNFIRRANGEFRAAFPSSQLTFSVRVWPNAYRDTLSNGSNPYPFHYDFAELAELHDFFVIMGYDVGPVLGWPWEATEPGERAWDQHSNAPLPALMEGIDEYMLSGRVPPPPVRCNGSWWLKPGCPVQRLNPGLGIAASKLVLALPW